MLRHPEPTKERVEPTILSIIEITHLTRMTLLLLLRFQRYMWSNHVVTWVYADNSGMNLTLIFAFALYFAILFFSWI